MKYLHPIFISLFAISFFIALLSILLWILDFSDFNHNPLLILLIIIIFLSIKNNKKNV